MPQANRLGERLGNESALTHLLTSPALSRTSQPVLLAAVNGPSTRLDVATPVASARALSLHEWIPMGSLSDRTQCRCCHCGVVRRYDLSRDTRVEYSKYASLLSEGELETADVPACVPAGSRMPMAVGARCWDMLSWV